MVRVMEIEDYDSIFKLWMKIKGFAIRSLDDSREGVAFFLKRNPTTSVVAFEDGKVVGTILCGHDGRRGCMYHVCVDPDYRMQGIGKSMVVKAMEEKFGVTAAAPVMVAGAAGAVGAEDSAEEQSEFTISLESFDATKKIAAIKATREVTALGLKEAKDLVEGAPKVLKEGISKEDAEKIKATIEAAGGVVKIA